MGLATQHRVTAMTTIAAPREYVWRVLCDMGRYEAWIENTLELLHADEVASLGATFEERARLSGFWTSVVHWTVMGFDPPSRLVFMGRGARGVRDLTFEVELEPLDGGTEIASTYAYVPRFGLLGTLLELVVRGNVVADQKRSLRTFALLVERDLGLSNE